MISAATSTISPALSFSAQAFAAPSPNSNLVKRNDITAIQDSFNASAATSNGKPSFSTMFTTFQGVASSMKVMSKTVTPLMQNPIADLTAEEIQVLVGVLEVYKNVLLQVEQVVDAVVNSFFPGFLDLFRPFIQIWINVVDSFTDPFFNFYTQLVSQLTGSPNLVKAINDYISEIKQIRDNFLLTF
ncbi:hypothetical protein V502_10125 [Pseudogymnoascus sp. VKM F-4520 (FW-2644)]|nr:hypothetical protein V502_10125 [Pseudogymnoascus sp. VKM F-4520 (FW-2644)]